MAGWSSSRFYACAREMSFGCVTSTGGSVLIRGFAVEEWTPVESGRAANVLLERVVIERSIAVVAVVDAVRSRRGQTTSRTTQIRSGYDCQMVTARLTTARHSLLAAACKQRGKPKVMRLKLAIWASCLNTLVRRETELSSVRRRFSCCFVIQRIPRWSHVAVLSCNTLRSRS
jgi:hypothetical protein